MTATEWSFGDSWSSGSLANRTTEHNTRDGLQIRYEIAYKHFREDRTCRVIMTDYLGHRVVCSPRALSSRHILQYLETPSLPYLSLCGPKNLDTYRIFSHLLDSFFQAFDIQDFGARVLDDFATMSNNTQALEKQFTTDIATIEKNLVTIIEQQNSSTTEVQQTCIVELRSLFKQKTSIEEEIIQITAELNAVYQQTKGVLKVVLSGRMDDYGAALEQLGNPEDRDPLAESQEL